jgi:hypothetical protein
MEVKKMKNRIFILAMIAVLVSTSCAVVGAEPTNGQKVDASMTLTYIAYSSTNPATNTLTKLCTQAGLTSNPYPAPTVPETFTVPGNEMISQVREQSSYYLISLTIDGESYTGVACFIYNGERNKDTGLTIHHFDGNYYIGAIGHMDNGFIGNLQMKIYGYYLTTSPIDYGTTHCELQGFGTFDPQTLSLSHEFTVFANVFKEMTGYCNKG